MFISPKAQDVLRSYLDRDPKRFCFSPVDSESRRRRAMRAARLRKVQPSHVSRRKKRPRREPGERYWEDSFARSIERACKKAWPTGERRTGEQAKAWHKSHRWTPNRLRRTAATKIRWQFGLEAAQVILGHSRADVTQVYAERDRGLAVEVMAKIG